MKKIKGLHHTSSIVKNAQENVDFYASFFGLRLVKQTSNHENMEQYHLYYSNHDASSALSTHFPMQGSEEGKIGDGQTETVRYAIPVGSMPFWEKRLDDFGLFHFRYKRFNQTYLAFNDPHGLALEMVETDLGKNSTWNYNHVTEDVAIKDIYNVSIASKRPESTLKLFTEIFGYTIDQNDDEYFRLKLHDGIGGTVDIRKQRSEDGVGGTGTVHHIALSIANGSAEYWKKRLMDAGYFPTAVKNRFYFESLYFNDKGGITIELATEGPGLTYDEPLGSLGKNFIIAPHQKDDTELILNSIPPIEVKPIDHFETYSYRNKEEYDMVQARKQLAKDLKDLKEKGASVEEINEFKKASLQRR